MSHADDMIDAAERRAMRSGPLATPEGERDDAQRQAESYRRQFNAAHNERCRLRKELAAMAEELVLMTELFHESERQEELTLTRALAAEAQLSDVRHSEARYKVDRDEAQARARQQQAARIEALKRARRAEREVEAALALRRGISERHDPAGMHRVHTGAVASFDAAMSAARQGEAVAHG